MNLHPPKERGLVASNLNDAAANIANATDALEACLRFPPAVVGYEAFDSIQSLVRDVKPLWKRAIAARKQVQSSSTER